LVKKPFFFSDRHPIAVFDLLDDFDQALFDSSVNHFLVSINRSTVDIVQIPQFGTIATGTVFATRYRAFVHAAFSINMVVNSASRNFGLFLVFESHNLPPLKFFARLMISPNKSATTNVIMPTVFTADFVFAFGSFFVPVFHASELCSTSNRRMNLSGELMLVLC
jgi:hypothetical protein